MRWHVVNLCLLVGIAGLMAGFQTAPVPDMALWLFWAIIAFGGSLGILLFFSVSDADVPVTLSLLNSFSGWAAAALGFTVQNMALIIAGAMVGAAGVTLAHMMCRARGRRLMSVLFGRPPLPRDRVS